MKITFFFFCKTTFPFVKEGCDIFIKRIKHYTPFELVELPELNNVSSLSRVQVKVREGELIVKNIREGVKVILLV